MNTATAKRRRLSAPIWRVVSMSCAGFPPGVCGPGIAADHHSCLTPECACKCHGPNA